MIDDEGDAEDVTSEKNVTVSVGDGRQIVAYVAQTLMTNPSRWIQSRCTNP